MNNIVKLIIQTIVNLSNKGVTPISFESHTVLSMNKTSRIDGTPNPFLGKVVKVSNVGGLIGVNYENSVNRQLDREGKESDFKVSPRKWGFHDEENPFLIRHLKKGETVESFYLQVKVQQTNEKPTYINTENGKVIDVKELISFLPPRNKPNTQSELDKEIIIRDYGISTFRKLSIGGQKFDFNPMMLS